MCCNCTKYYICAQYSKAHSSIGDEGYKKKKKVAVYIDLL